tara:strand:+ start:4232 stop:4456 length:225 start_codon:yes stop_codon:yes gene_type:complete
MVTAKGLRVLNSRPNTTTGDLYANKFEERQAKRRKFNAGKKKLHPHEVNTERPVVYEVDPRELITSPPEVWAKE